MRIAFLAFALCLASQVAFCQSAPSAATSQTVKSLADITEFCSNPTGAGSFDATRKTAMDKWASDHGFKPITGPCKATGQWILSWTESVADTHSAVIEQSASGGLQVRQKRLPGTLKLSRVSETSLEPTGDVLFVAQAANIEDGLNAFVQGVGQAKQVTAAPAPAVSKRQVTATKQPAATKPAKPAKQVTPVSKQEKQVGGD